MSMFYVQTDPSNNPLLHLSNNLQNTLILQPLNNLCKLHSILTLLCSLDILTKSVHCLSGPLIGMYESSPLPSAIA